MCQVLGILAERILRPLDLVDPLLRVVVGRDMARTRSVNTASAVLTDLGI